MDIHLPSFISIKKFVKRFPFRVRLYAAASLFVLGWSLFCYKTVTHYFRLQALSDEVALLSSTAKLVEKQKTLHRLIEKQIAAATPGYLSQVVESLPLLEKEKEHLLLLAQQFPNTAPLRDRLLFLQSGQNRIRLDGSHMQMDGGDLRNFLEAVEGSRYDGAGGKPFLLIKKFDLLRCAKEGDEAVYSVQAELQ